MFNENWRLTSRIKNQEIPPALKRLFFDKLRLDGIFAKEQAGKTRMRAERIVIKRDHSALSLRAAGSDIWAMSMQ